MEEYKQTNCEYVYKNCLQWKSDLDEAERKAEIYVNDLKVLREQKKLQVYAKNSTAIEALTDVIQNATGSDRSLALDEQIGLIDEQIPLVEDLQKEATEEGSSKADLFRLDLIALRSLRNIAEELKRRLSLE